MSVTLGTSAGATSSAGHQSGQTITYRGYQVTVPRDWQVVDLTASPSACVRFDRPAVYLGRPGDQSDCPAHLIGGAPGLLIQSSSTIDSVSSATTVVPTASTGGVSARRLPAQGPVTIDVQAAGVVVTAVYGDATGSLTRDVLAGGRVLASARPSPSKLPLSPSGVQHVGTRAPGTYLGTGFDACTAPSQSAMNGWLSSSRYRAVGVYIGGVSRGCAQPNLTRSWVNEQVSQGWHLIPTYVGLQAPCTNFYNRMSSTASTAKAQGRAEAADAAAQADALGMAAPSTIYADIEGYNNTISSCVTAVLSYASGWTRGLHEAGYQAGVYSSASSGMRDLSASYKSSTLSRPDDIWLAWWNYAADVDGGSYVPSGQWSQHQRVHQYVGAVTETHGGYTINVDRDYLDVTNAVTLPRGCPTRLDFADYRVIRSDDHGDQVRAIQCQLARRGFDPGDASGTVKWRTGAAITAFNASRGLPGQSIVGRRSWTALLSGGRTRLLEKGDAGPMVGKLQRSLSASLQHRVPVSEVFDGATRTAVLLYQNRHHLLVDGTASHATWNELRTGH